MFNSDTLRRADAALSRIRKWSSARAGGSDMPTPLSAYLTDLFRDREWSAGHVAASLGVSRQYVSAIAGGRSDPSDNFLEKVSELLGVDVLELMIVKAMNRV